MARIAGIDLPKDKRIEIGLTYIYGIGRKSAQDILAQTGINPDTRVKDLTDAEEAKLREAIDHGYMVEGDLRRQTALQPCAGLAGHKAQCHALAAQLRQHAGCSFRSFRGGITTFVPALNAFSMTLRLS